MPKVSILIPIYNDENFIKDLVDSILGQTFKDFECLLYIHGSIDNSYALLNKITKKDKRIKLLKVGKNIASGAVNKLVQQAKGEYIKFFCADDIMMKDCIEKQVLFFDNDTQSKYSIVFSRIVRIDSQGNEFREDEHNRSSEILNKNRYEHLNYMFYKANYQFSYPSMMIRRSVIDKNSYFIDERFAQINDTMCWINLLLDGYEAYILDDILVKYRIHNNNVSNIYDLGNKARFIFEFRQFLEPYLIKIKTFEELLNIFPESEEFTRKLDKTKDCDLIPFIICQLALSCNGRIYHFLEIHKNFAISKIFDILGDPKIASKIYEKFNFHYCDLKNLTLSHPSSLETESLFTETITMHDNLKKRRGFFGIPYRIKKKLMKLKQAKFII